VTDTLILPEIRWDTDLPERNNKPFVPTTKRPTSRERKLVAVSLAVIVLAAWFLATFWTSVDVRSPRQPYLAPTANQSWVRSAGTGPHAFFRLALPIGSMPQSATLWLSADQTAIPYLNGAPLGSIPKIDTLNGSYIPRIVEILDIRPALSLGANVLGLEVINYDNRAPAFQARIRLQTGQLVQTLGTKPSDWSSTANVALTDQITPRSGTWATTTFTPANWASAILAGHRIGATTVSTPPEAYLQPADGQAIAGANTGRQLTVSTALTFPPGCTSGWLRIAANGPYTVSLGGQVVASGGGTWEQLGVQPSFIPLYVTPISGSIPLTIYDLCPFARGGTNQLSISVDVASTSAPLIYADGQVADGPSVMDFQMGPGWKTSGFAQPNLIANPEGLLRTPFQLTTAAGDVPSGPQFAHTLVIFLELVLIACAVAFVLVLLGSRRGRALRSVAAGTLPALGLVLVLIEYQHFIGVQPPFPSTPLMLHIVLIVAASGIVLSAGLALSSRPVGLGTPNVVERPPHTKRAKPVSIDLAIPARRPQRFVAWLRARPYEVAVFGVALFWVLLLSYRIDYQQLWQDELSSIAAAQGIGAHLVPRWPSGFLYWKSELYSALLAVVGTLTHYRTSYLRELSVLWFGGTVMLFGTRLLPLVVRRRSFQLAGTVVFASAAIEQSHAQEVRMYQMVQFFVVLLAIALLKAVREPTTRRVAVVMIVVVCMYLSHEESFGVLPLVPLTLFGFLGFSWCKNWRWWVFGGLAAACIAIQLSLAELTHPPSFGVDLSGGPLLQWSPRPFYYIVNVFFTSGSAGAVLTIISLFAVAGIIIGWRKRDHTLIYLAAFWIIPVIVVSLLLPAKNPRYVFLTLPFVFLLATRAASDIYQFLRSAVTTGERGPSRSARRVLTILFALACGLAALMSTVGSLTDYGPLTETLFGADVQHNNVGLDFPNAVAYIKAHQDPGDAIIAVGPANLTGGSLGHPPTYWLPANRTHDLLYVFEKGNQPVDTEYGIPVLLNAAEFETAIDAHRRVWLISSDSNANRFLPSVRTIVGSRFKLVYEGESVSVFLCTN